VRIAGRDSEIRHVNECRPESRSGEETRGLEDPSRPLRRSPRQSFLAYVGDAAIDARQYSGQCRDALHELKPYARGLLKAPTPPLRRDALRVHHAGLAYLRACVRGRAVAWHHGDAAWEVSTTQANIDFARAMGANPTGYDAPKVFG
jgi:hypothetical protein